MAGRKPIPKTQKEISNSFVTPYDVTQGNPNDAIASPKNRALQQSWKGDTTKPFTISIQDIDEAIFYYLENVIKPTVKHNGEILSVPVLYGSPEKWKSYQKDGYLRDLKGSLMAPLIIFKRESIDKNRSITNKQDANNPYNYGIFQKSYSTKNAYSRFDLLNNRVPEKQYYAVVIPDYVTVTYTFIIFTYYVEQLNGIVEAMNYASDAYWGDPERFKFRASIDSFGFQTQLNESSERVVRSTFTLKLNGHIIPDVIQKDTTAISKFNNKTKTTLFFETVNAPGTTSMISSARTSIPSTTFIDSNLVPGGGSSGGGSVDPSVFTYLVANYQKTGTVTNSTTVTFNIGWLNPPSGIPVPDVNSFTFFCNGSLIEKSAITSFTQSAGVSTLVVDTSLLGYSLAVTDEVIGIGKFESGD
jgi:hypothetical protein